MANSFYTPTQVAKEALRRLEAKLVLGKIAKTDLSSEFAMVGQTIKVRRPTAYLGQANNLDITSYTEDVTQGVKDVTMSSTLSIPVVISAIDRTLSFDRWSEDVLDPAMQRMAEAVEASLAANYSSFYWYDGTPGTVPSTFSALADLGAIMTDANIGQMGRVAVHSPSASAKLASTVAATYVDGKNKTAMEKASIGTFGGFDNFESVFAPTHTVGTATGTPAINGASQNVTYATAKDTWSQTLNTDGWTNSVTGILKAGDVFTIANVYAVNPSTKASTGRLQTFVVLADANSGASTGPAALTISPPIITSGAYQTVNSAPADNALLTVKGTGGTAYRQSLMMQPGALMLVTRPLDIGSGLGVRTHSETGNRVSISVTEFINGNTLAQTMRFDMLWGTANDPRLAARLTN